MAKDFIVQRFTHVPKKKHKKPSKKKVSIEKMNQNPKLQ